MILVLLAPLIYCDLSNNIVLTIAVEEDEAEGHQHGMPVEGDAEV